MRRLCLALILLVPALPLGAAGDPIRDRMELLLSGHERLPGREELLSVSADAELLLQEIILHPSPRALARNRALTLLRLFPSLRSQRLLRDTIRQSTRAAGGLAWLDLQQALSSYAVVAGPAALPVIRPFLAHQSRDLRHAAISCLPLTRSPKVRAILEAQRKLEPSAAVRVRIDRELTRLRHHN